MSEGEIQEEEKEVKKKVKNRTISISRSKVLITEDVTEDETLIDIERLRIVTELEKEKLALEEDYRLTSIARSKLNHQYELKIETDMLFKPDAVYVAGSRDGIKLQLQTKTLITSDQEVDTFLKKEVSTALTVNKPCGHFIKKGTIFQWFSNCHYMFAICWIKENLVDFKRDDATFNVNLKIWHNWTLKFTTSITNEINIKEKLYFEMAKSLGYEDSVKLGSEFSKFFIKKNELTVTHV